MPESSRRQPSAINGGLKAKIRRLFIYKTDTWHFLLGFASGLLFQYLKWITILAALIFILYQHFEHEPIYESVKDTVTFLSGLIIALLIVL